MRRPGCGSLPEDGCGSLPEGGVETARRLRGSDETKDFGKGITNNFFSPPQGTLNKHPERINMVVKTMFIFL